jgi:GWxTD domain-containing protein
MRTKTLFTYAAFILLPLALASFSFPQLQAEKAKRLNLSIDAAQFVAEPPYIKVEIYQSIGRDRLTYRREGNTFRASFDIETTVLHADSVIFRHTVNESDSVAGESEIKSGQQFVYAHPILLSSGQYRLVTKLTDHIAKLDASRSLPLEVGNFSNDSLALSDIQMATSIQKTAGAASGLDKNNLRITPNPQCLYGDGQENLTFYAELYNLLDAGKEPGAYQVDYVIENDKGEFLNRLPGKSRRKAGSRAAIYAAFDISTLASGTYRLRLEARDQDTGRRTTAVKKFMVFRREEDLAKAEGREQSIYLNLDAAAMQAYFDKLNYIANGEEKAIFHQLDLSGKQNFLVEFWHRRDPTPGTPRNEFKDDYIQRLVQAQASFSVGNTEGWKTDRGRIFLTYGAPNHIDREPDSPDKNAFEVWSYNDLEGGAQFIFIDMSSDSNYKLVHSTYRKEVNDPNWQFYLYR